MLVNTIACLFCMFLSKELIILSIGLGYKLSHYLNCFPSDGDDDDGVRREVYDICRMVLANRVHVPYPP